MRRRICLSLALALLASLIFSSPALAATTADVTVTATPSYISIAMDTGDDSYDFSVVVASSTPSTATDAFTVVNGSTVITDVTIGVTASSWSGGVTWAHSDTCTPGVDTAGLKANKGGTWGTGDVIIKYSSPNFITEDQAATTNFDFGLKLWAPTEFGDGVEKAITVRLTATEAS